MSENLKYFATLDDADGYIIEDIPWVGYVEETDLVLYCNTSHCVLATINNLLDIISADSLLIYNATSKFTLADNLGTVNVHNYNSKSGNGYVIYSSTTTYINNNAFQDCKNLIYVSLPNTITTINLQAFAYCSNLKTVFIPSSITYIGKYAFSGCSSLSSINIPSSTQSILEGAFENCVSLPVTNNIRYADTYLVEAVDKTLSSYSIKEGTRWIGNMAFYHCTNLTSITLPNSVQTISVSAFSGSNLSSINLPENISRIDYYSLPGSLTSITCHATTPPFVMNYSFYYVSKSIPVYVPAQYVSNYQLTLYWNSFTNIQAIPV